MQFHSQELWRGINHKMASEYDQVLLVSYKNLRVHALSGRLLQTLHETYIPEREGLEVGLPKFENEIEIVSLFHHQPTIDLQIYRNFNDSAHIVAYSLEEDIVMTKKLIEETTNLTNLVSNSKPGQVLMDAISANMLDCAKEYEVFKAYSKSLNIPIETFFSSFRYANFLHQHRKMSPEESMNMATERYPIPKDLSEIVLDI
jgi:hypothetical protein